MLTFSPLLSSLIFHTVVFLFTFPNLYYLLIRGEVLILASVPQVHITVYTLIFTAFALYACTISKEYNSKWLYTPFKARAHFSNYWFSLYFSSLIFFTHNHWSFDIIRCSTSSHHFLCLDFHCFSFIYFKYLKISLS